jgi:hypothetical protein
MYLIFSWYDGFSTFHVNAAGEVVKHVADKMMPDSDSVAEKVPTTPLAAAKLAFVAGLIPSFRDIPLIT